MQLASSETRWNKNIDKGRKASNSAAEFKGQKAVRKRRGVHVAKRCIFGFRHTLDAQQIQG